MIKFTRNAKRGWLSFSILCAALIAAMAACGGGSGSGGGGGGTTYPNAVLFVASGANGNGEILDYPINPSTGALETFARYDGPEAIAQMQPDPAGKYLYASDFNAGSVHVYAVDAKTGALDGELTGSPFTAPGTEGNGGPIAVAPNGKWVFYSDATGDIATFVWTGGALVPNQTALPPQVQPFLPSQMVVDATSSFLYVANHADANPGEQFFVFSINQTTGALAPVAGSPFGSQSNSEPSGIALHPTGNFLYSALANASGIDGLNVNKTTGALSSIPGAPWPTTAVLPQFVVVTPSGDYLYASLADYGYGLIDAYSISESGALSSISEADFGGGGPMAMEPSGRYLYETFSNGEIPLSGFVLAYPIDSSTGTLGKPENAVADASPGALTVVKLP
jgi:6-phosphogluconolactonase (cycloisomerase 2 family)